MAIYYKPAIYATGSLFLFFLLVLLGALLAFKNAWTSLPAVITMSTAGGASFICLILFIVFIILYYKAIQNYIPYNMLIKQEPTASVLHVSPPAVQELPVRVSPPAVQELPVPPATATPVTPPPALSVPPAIPGLPVPHATPAFSAQQQAALTSVSTASKTLAAALNPALKPIASMYVDHVFGYLQRLAAGQPDQYYQSMSSYSKVTTNPELDAQADAAVQAAARAVSAAAESASPEEKAGLKDQIELARARCQQLYIKRKQ